MRRTALVIATLVSVLALVTTTSVAATSDATATIAPLTGGKGTPFVAATGFDLASVGYEQSEYLLSGTASAYASASPLTSDGKWTVSPATRAPFTTRMIVYRPTDAKRFNGTVVVEWNNVSGGVDASPFWLSAHPELIRAGYAWVGVTLQSAGVSGGGASVVADLDLQHADPDRYGSLEHPGDSFSYDMFRQAGRAVRADGARLLGGLEPEHVIGVGESQSAFRLTTYVDAIEPLSKGTYDGYFLHSRLAPGAALSQDPQPSIATPTPTRIRSDLTVPVMTFSTETDVIALGYQAARQRDSQHFRSWEVAGTAHADSYTLVTGRQDTGEQASDVELFQAMLDPPSGIYNDLIKCGSPFNTGPGTYVLRAALHALHSWVVDGTPPPKAPRLATTGDDAAPLSLDADGNVEGGIRTPHVDAPVATLSGLGQTGNNFCGLFGTTKPFDAAALASRYPSHPAFVKAWNEATDRAVRAGFLLRADARRLKAVAADSTVGS